jgi:RNA polymerase sigma factor (sigma-70 family)
MRDKTTKVKQRAICGRDELLFVPNSKAAPQRGPTNISKTNFVGFPTPVPIYLETMISDLELLQNYARNKSEESFAALVNRHLNLVYSAALRQVRSPQLAEEVAQSAFTDLARNAVPLCGMKPDTILTAWLYQVARRTAIDVVRRESRRQLREQIAVEMTNMNATSTDWTQIGPQLDDAMDALDDTDRTAVLLRYFENKTLREVGATLGTTDDAAQKRVSRAVERLREFFAKRGVTVGASGLVVVISANAVQAAPVGLAVTISSAAALAGTTLATTTTATAIKTIAMTILQKTLITAAITAAVGTGIYEARQASSLRSQVQTLQQQQAPLAEQLTKLQTENERLSNQVVQAKDSQALSKAQLNELLKLRGQAGPAQANSRELAKLKSTLAQQTSKTPDFLTNAMAMGLSTAEKWKMKDAQARLDRMKKMLNLTDDQAQAISDIMQKHIQNQTQMTMDMMTGKFTPEQQKAMVADQGNQQAEIKALFTPEQLAAYPEYLQAEVITAADNSAKNDASRIAGDFSLSEAQQEQIHAAFYQVNLNAPQAAISAAKQSGNLADAANMGIELQKSQLEEKLKILGSILTPEQINTYREQQMNQINMQAAAMKMFLPQKTTGTSN